jgi:hypothetical protein
VTKLVVGIFGHRSDASLAIEAVQESGIKAKKISVVTKQKNAVELISHDTGIGKPEAGLGNEGLFGTFKGLAVGLDMLSDTAVTAGPAARKLAGAELDMDTGADGLTVSLMGLGIPDEDAERYAKHADKEHIIVIVALEEGEQPGPVSSLFNEHHAIPLESL